jgi:hypothetical protein
MGSEAISNADASDSTVAIPQHHAANDGAERRHRGWLTRLRDDVNLSYADLPILACCTVSGLCDSVAFNATGTFASMQTGAFSLRCQAVVVHFCVWVFVGVSLCVSEDCQLPLLHQESIRGSCLAC